MNEEKQSLALGNAAHGERLGQLLRRADLQLRRIRECETAILSGSAARGETASPGVVPAGQRVGGDGDSPIAAGALTPDSRAWENELDKLSARLDELTEMVIDAHDELVKRDHAIARTLSDLQQSMSEAEGLKQRLRGREAELESLEKQLASLETARAWARHESEIVASMQAELERAQAWARHETEAVRSLEATLSSSWTSRFAQRLRRRITPSRS